MGGAVFKTHAMTGRFRYKFRVSEEAIQPLDKRVDLAGRPRWS